MTLITGAFETREMAARAADQVIAGGLQPDRVSVLDRHGELAEATPEGGTGRRILISAAIGGAAGLLLAVASGGAPPVESGRPRPRRRD